MVLTVCKQCEYDTHILFTSLHDKWRSYMCKKARNAGDVEGIKLEGTKSQDNRWVVTDCHTTGICEGVIYA